jgi:hypothetical protein
VVIDESQYSDSRKCFVDTRDVEGVTDAHGRVILEVRVSGCYGLNLPVSRLSQHSHAGIAEIDALLQQRFHGQVARVCAKRTSSTDKEQEHL